MSIVVQLKIWFEKTQVLCKKLSRSQKFFLFGAAMAVFAAVFWLIQFSQASFSFVVLSGLLIISGVVSDFLSIYTRVWASALGKALILLLYALSTTVAYALAAQIVNGIVAFESSTLSNAVAFVAILLVPLFIFGSTYFLFAIIFILGQFYLILVMYSDILRNDECFKSLIPKNFENYPGRTFAARLFVIYPAAIGFTWGIGGNLLPKYDEFVEESAAAFIYHLEAVEFSRCNNIPSEDKVIHVNDQEIIVASKGTKGFDFTPLGCVPKISSNKPLNGDAASGAH